MSQEPIEPLRSRLALPDDERTDDARDLINRAEAKELLDARSELTAKSQAAA